MKRVVILGGGGLMGHGMVLACLRSPETEVVLLSRRQESLDHGATLVRTGRFGIERSVERGKMSREEAAQMLARLRTTLDYEEGLAGADLIFETVPEVLDLKKKVLAEAGRAAPATAVFASGTSSIMISELSSALDDPGRLVGTHWFYPANVMPLVEVARGQLSRDDAVEPVLAFLRNIGKKPVLVADAPGFFMTRFINLYIAEAIRLVELGVAGPSEIDEMVKTGLGWPMGVFELLDDTASFDSWYHAQEYLHETCGERYAVPPLARKVFRAGYRGNPALKPGSRGGWYDFLGIQRTGGKS
ncbi:MAG: 3-hydroxyacyl-CoA dehydrogenase NAD-binding domain-containing protein [Actinobacteria bacterium]|nr:3-hydroxyacyl-CoA dehydrogenase NAD-binding domain-containing protein [Actinomycetota bacterium]